MVRSIPDDIQIEHNHVYQQTEKTAQDGYSLQLYPITAGKMVNVLRSKKMMQKILTINPEMKRSEVVNDLLV